MKTKLFLAVLAAGAALGCSSPQPPKKGLPPARDRVPRGLHVLVRPFKKESTSARAGGDLVVRFWIHYTNWTEPLPRLVAKPGEWNALATVVAVNQDTWWEPYTTRAESVDNPIILSQHTPFMMAFEGVHLKIRVAPLPDGKVRLDLRMKWKTPQALVKTGQPRVKTAGMDGFEIPGGKPIHISMSAPFHDELDPDRYQG